ncbi:hypothetical protein VKT23_015777 [Stygiomarasmius scandens]|uniref:Uncharacterized protein n=1 Tax=Marasmiellus scandens TaxID=2682957 RepID=A0ABR1IWF6_9AGAR
MDSAATATMLVTTERNRTYRIWNPERSVMHRGRVQMQSAMASRQASSVFRTPTRRKRVISSSQPLRRSPRLKRLHPCRSPRIQAMMKQRVPAKKVLATKRVDVHRRPRVQNRHIIPVQPQVPQVPPTPRTLNRVVRAARVILDAFPGVGAAPAPAPAPAPAQPPRRSAPYWPVNRAYVLVPRATAMRRPVPVQEDDILESSDIDDTFAEDSDSFEVDTDASGDFDPFEDNDDDDDDDM